MHIFSRIPQIHVPQYTPQNCYCVPSEGPVYHQRGMYTHQKSGGMSIPRCDCMGMLQTTVSTDVLYPQPGSLNVDWVTAKKNLYGTLDIAVVACPYCNPSGSDLTLTFTGSSQNPDSGFSFHGTGNTEIKCTLTAANQTFRLKGPGSLTHVGKDLPPASDVSYDYVMTYDTLHIGDKVVKVNYFSVNVIFSTSPQQRIAFGGYARSTDTFSFTSCQ